MNKSAYFVLNLQNDMMPRLLYKRASIRTKKSAKNIALSFVTKGFSIIISLILVPLTINYVNPTRYGIWLTLSSIISWIGFFDLGLGNGMRNRYAEAKANGQLAIADQYISTAYFSISVIMALVLIIALFANFFVNWASVLNVPTLYNNELKVVFGVLAVFFSLNVIFKTFSTLLTADQEPGIASIINVLGQFMSLVVIFVLAKVSNGSLLYLALSYSGIPTFVILVCSLYAYYFTRYSRFRPQIRKVRLSLVRNVMNLGLQFFVIYLCMIIIFQIINVVISRELGPNAVTEYNIAYKYFNVLFSIVAIIVTPFWSAFTDAYSLKDFVWMKRVIRKMEHLWMVSILTILVMVALSNLFYVFWVGSEIHISLELTISLALYFVSMIAGYIYMNLINGIGTIRIQLIIYVVFAIVSAPILTFTCRWFGLPGVVLAPSLVYVVQAVFGKMQLNKLLNNKASGIWLK